METPEKVWSLSLRLEPFEGAISVIISPCPGASQSILMASDMIYDRLAEPLNNAVRRLCTDLQKHLQYQRRADGKSQGGSGR